MRSRRTLAAAVAVIAMMAGRPGGAAPTGAGGSFAKPTAGHPSVSKWTGVVLQAPRAATDIAPPTTPATCAGAAAGLCQDIPLTVPSGLKTSTLYVRVAWRSPIWKAYLYVTSPDGSKVYPSTAETFPLPIVNQPQPVPTDCDAHLFNKGCRNESSPPND